MKKNIPYGTLVLVFISTAFFSLTHVDASWAEKFIGFFWHEMLPVHQGEIWRMLLGPFIHYEISHFLGNTVFLAYFGYQVERNHGTGILISVFILTNIIGFALIYLIYGYSGVFGISGSVCGLYGFLLLTLEWKKTVPETIKSHWVFILYALILAMLAMAPGGLDLLHLFGIIAGSLFGLTLLQEYKIRFLRYSMPVITLLAITLLAFNPLSAEWDVSRKNYDSFSIIRPNTCSRIPDFANHKLSKSQSILLALAGNDIYVVNATSEPKHVLFMNKQNVPTHIGRLAPHAFSMSTYGSEKIQFRSHTGKCAEINLTTASGTKLLVDLKGFTVE